MKKLTPLIIMAITFASCSKTIRANPLAWAINKEDALLAILKTKHAQLLKHPDLHQPAVLDYTMPPMPTSLEVSLNGEALRVHFSNSTSTDLYIDEFTATFTYELLVPAKIRLTANLANKPADVVVPGSKRLSATIAQSDL